MKKILSTILLSSMVIGGFAQTTINFEEENHKAVSTYDYWENSPFRTGKLDGQFEIIDNPAKEEGVNDSEKVLAFKRSRYGSNLYGARIDLKTPIQLSSTPSYVHVLIKTPNKGNIALVGLGKRNDWEQQSPETFQLVRQSTKEIPAGKWTDAVFKVYGNEAAQLYSLVIIPDTKSMLPTDQDYVVYIDEIIHNNDSQERFSNECYPLSFEKTQQPTRTDRKLNGVTFKGNEGANLTLDISSSGTVYTDKLEDAALTVVPGEEITASFNYSGEWMHRYVYLDKGNDGKFTPEIQNNIPTENSDLVAYSFLSDNNASSGYNSKGESVENNTKLDPPAFTIPENMTPGFYRIRCKVDWNSDNAAGNPGQSIVSNGGAVLDLLANVHAENVNFSVNARMCNVTTVDGEQLPATIPFGKDYTFNVKMDGDYVIKGLQIKHGYNLSGEQYVNENRQWKNETLYLTNDGEVTIPAKYIDGDLSVEILFSNTPSGEGSYPEMKRTYQAADQENRYLREVVATVDGQEQTIFTATTKEELPYTQFVWTSGWVVSNEGALIDKTTVPVNIPEGTASFQMTFKPWNEEWPAASGSKPCTQQLVWTNQAYYIDFNNDYEFAGVVNGVNEISDIAGTPGNNNNFDDPNGDTEKGWTRTITIPNNLKPGTYRMRVVYLEPGSTQDGEYGDDWNEKLFTELNGVIRCGISYDFEINITESVTEKFPISWDQPQNGTLTVKSEGKTLSSGDEVEKDTEITIEAVPDKGFQLKEIKVNNVKIDATDGVYTTTITQATTIEATFEELVSISGATFDGIYYNSEDATLYVGTTESIKIFDISGKLVFETKENRGNINLSNLAEGIYTAVTENETIKFRK